ncbi:MAG TPA: hypothetical protein VEF04_01185, partial [Blastocatellia bacterium]|nr:hypothetical protein [Blastocatellia bacterium]
MTLRVPPKKGSAGTFVCFTNPACPEQPIPVADRFAVFAKADNPKRKAISFESERALYTAKNHGRNVWDKADRKLEKYFVFALKDGEAVLLNKQDAESAFTLSSEIEDSAAEQGAASYAPPQLNAFGSKRERNATLEENFGSRKRRKNQQKMKM